MPDATTDTQLPHRRLGRSDLSIPVITFGAMTLGGRKDDDARRIATIRAAIEAGTSAIDTAPLYEFGHSEELVGRAIRDRRDRVQLLTKVGLRWDDDRGELLFRARGANGEAREVRRNSRPESVRAEVERSLKRLDVDTIDLVQVHHRDRDTPIAETMGALLRLRSEGKLAEIGVSNYTAQEMAEADTALGDVPLASVQCPYNLVLREIEADVLPAAREASIGLLCYSPLEKSLLAGRLLQGGLAAGDSRAGHWSFHPRNARLVNGVLSRVVTPIARRHEATLAQIALAWLLAQPGVTSVVVGASSDEQVASNARAGSLELSVDEVDEIRAAFESIRLDPNVGPSRAQRAVRRIRSRLGRIRRKLLGDR